MDKKRLPVIILLGWFLIISSSIFFIRKISYLIRLDFHRGFPLVVNYDWITFLFIIAGVGLLMFKNWARKLTILLFAIKTVFYLQPIYLIFTPTFRELNHLYFFVFNIAIYLIFIFSLINKKIKELFEVDRKQFIITWITGLSIFYFYVFGLVFMYFSRIDPKSWHYTYELIFPTIIKMILPPLVIGYFLFYFEKKQA